MARSTANGTGKLNHDGAPRLAPLGADPHGAALAQLPPDDGAPNVDDLLGELGGTAAAVQLWRVNDRGGKPAYVERINAEGFSLDYVREIHGGGTYQARVVGDRNRILKQATFVIAGDTRRETAPNAPNAGTEGDRLARLERMVETLVVNGARTAPDAGEPLNMALRIVEAMKPAMSQPAPATTPAADMFALMSQMLDLRERIADDASPARGPDFGALIEKGVSPLVGLFDRQLTLEEKKLSRNNPPNGKTRTTGAEGAAVAMRREPSETPAAATGPAEQLAARVPTVARVYLRGCAAADKDPALYAEVVLDALPEDVRAELPDLLARDGFAAELVAAVPQWRDYPGWFANLCEEMRAQLDGSDDDAEEDDAPNADGAE